MAKSGTTSGQLDMWSAFGVRLTCSQMYPPVEASGGQDQHKVRSTCLSIFYCDADYNKYYNQLQHVKHYDWYSIVEGIQLC